MGLIDGRAATYMVVCILLVLCIISKSGLEIRVDRWPESTKNPVGSPIQVRQWSGGLPKLCQWTLHLLAFLLRLLWR